PPAARVIDLGGLVAGALDDPLLVRDRAAFSAAEDVGEQRARALGRRLRGVELVDGQALCRCRVARRQPDCQGQGGQPGNGVRVVPHAWTSFCLLLALRRRAPVVAGPARTRGCACCQVAAARSRFSRRPGGGGRGGG